MTYQEHESFDKTEKIIEIQPFFRDKSSDSKKVAIVRRTLI